MKQSLSSILLFLTVFLFFTYPVGDADLGWHLKYGEYLITHRALLFANTFSSQLSNYVWANHSWGFDGLAYLIFKVTGFLGLSLSAALLISGSVWLLLKKFKTAALPAFVFMFFGRELLTTGLRSQLLSLLCTSLLWILLEAAAVRPKLARYGLPLLFLLWANLHGEYLVGLGLFAVYLIPHTNRHLIPVYLASVLATLINPFGINLIATALSHFSSPALQNIFEWMPWELTTSRMQLLLLFMVIFWWSTLKYKAATAGQKLMLACLTLLSLKARRMIPFFLLCTLPVLATTLKQVLPNLQKIRLQLLSAATLIILIFLLPSRHLTTQNWDTYCATNVRCSEKALDYIKSHQLTGKLFNAYGLGGWLIWRYPDMPVFVDGRMTLWQGKDGYSPFLAYLAMVHAKDTARTRFDQENFDYVLLQPQFELAQVLRQTLRWPILYEDNTLVLFANPNNPKF